jgi:two-component system, chemotaxis family, protein-glutamate methylesterase/glutaminase
MVPAVLTLPRAAGLTLPRVDAVVIGASAGGVEALLAVLPALPAETPFPVVVVLHISREGPNALVEIFSPRCAIAVREVTDKDPVAGATIWFAPPDYHVLVETDRTFSLSLEGLVNYSRPAIDPLFESAAAAYGPALVGVVLTGASADGADGAAAVREAGGVVVVQDPAQAESAAMPAAAIARARPDAIGSVAEIAGMLRAAAIARAR